MLAAEGTLLALHPFSQESLSQLLNYTAVEMLVSFAIILPHLLGWKIQVLYQSVPVVLT